MKIGVISFPGSNGDHDALSNLRSDLRVEAELIDYRARTLAGFDAVVLPGGFSYGDALRCGAIARFAPVMQPLRRAAEEGMPVLGICNGFQILCESHLIPGALLRNQTLRFHCFWTHIRIDNATTAWTNDLEQNEILRLPVAHGEGAYFCDGETLARLNAQGQVVARYVDNQGELTDAANANGSVESIAAVCNPAGNVVGLMPHPERATNALVGGADGLRLLRSITSLQSTYRS